MAQALIGKDGLNYGYLPKALLQFHKVIGTSRTALEEHLAEGAMYAFRQNEKVTVHFTVSRDHLPLVMSKVEEASAHIGHKYGVTFDVSYSVQKSHTDTVASNLDGSPYRENGKLFSAPGGHGALIENLNDLDADIIFIKNIDNVVPDERRASTVEYKKNYRRHTGGDKTENQRILQKLDKGTPSAEDLEEMLHFTRTVLCITHDNADEMSAEEKAEYLFSKLNRPTRVCGMVKNEGEPGGGPTSHITQTELYRLRFSKHPQIDPDNKETVKMMKNATHFNPVDLVVSTKDFRGKKFNLPDYVDKATGFISLKKSREGVEIKALELPVSGTVP